MSLPRVAAGALFFDEDGRVLLVKPTYKAGWEIPGGYVEPGETPTEACEREIKEELGLEREVGQLLAVDWAPSETEGDKVLFVFDGGQLARAAALGIDLASDELAEFHFYEPSEIGALLVARLARRVSAAITAAQTGKPVYLEHGVPVPRAGYADRTAT